MDLLYFIILVSSLIFVHEFGHFMVAKAFGVKVLTFSLGFGPKVVRLRGRETEYCVSLLPLGGYVKMLEASKSDYVPPEDRHRTFESLAVYKRLLIVLAGPVMNLIFPVILYFSVFVTAGPFLPPTVGVVLPGYPADGKLRPGDRVMAVNGQEIGTFDELKRIVAKHPGQLITFKVFRDNKHVDVEVVANDTIRHLQLDIVEHVGEVGIQPRAPAAVIGVPDPESPAYRAGLRTFDVVTHVAGREVKQFMDLDNAFADNRGVTVPVTYLRPIPVEGALQFEDTESEGLANMAVFLQELRARIERRELGPEATPAPAVSQDVQGAYVDEMKRRFQIDARALGPFVLDAGNGAGGPLALRTMKALGLAPDPLFCEMDGRFPNHHPDPTVLANLEALVARVRQTRARVGIAYDGDADRIGAVDENGDVVWGDKLMILFSRALLRDRPGATILGEVKCSQTLYDDIAKHGGVPIVYKTGHSLIKTRMKETGALLAGEMSGHVFFADRYFGYDDAIYASLRLLEILAADPRPLSAMLADVPKTFTTPELRVDCPDAVKFQVVAAVTARFKAAGNEVLDIDGARISFGAAAGAPPKWGLVRASNTGPVLVMRFEAGSAEELDAIRRRVEDVVAEERAKFAS